MDEFFHTLYGKVRAQELEQLRSTLDTSQLLTAIDELDHLCAQWRKQLRDDLFRLHGMAHTVINDAPLTIVPGDESFSEAAFSLAEELRDSQQSLLSLLTLLDRIADLEPD